MHRRSHGSDGCNPERQTALWMSLGGSNPGATRHPGLDLWEMPGKGPGLRRARNRGSEDESS